MFSSEMWKLHSLELVILIFAAVFIVIAVYVRRVKRKLNDEDARNDKSRASTEASPNYVSIDHRRLSEMLMNK